MRPPAGFFTRTDQNVLSAFPPPDARHPNVVPDVGVLLGADIYPAPHLLSDHFASRPQATVFHPIRRLTQLDANGSEDFVDSLQLNSRCHRSPPPSSSSGFPSGCHARHPKRHKSHKPRRHTIRASPARCLFDTGYGTERFFHTARLRQRKTHAPATAPGQPIRWPRLPNPAGPG